MSAKISALPSATEMANAEVLTIVQAAVNKKITKQAFLTAATGEPIALGGVVATIEIDASDNIQITVGFGQTLHISDLAGTNFVIIDAFGNVLVSAAPGTAVTTGFPGVSQVVVSETGLSVEAPTGSSADVTYHVGAAGNWAGSPTNMATALDRIAAAVAGLLGTAIP